jgi:mannan endo-1,4-beta-mannosidase
MRSGHLFTAMLVFVVGVFGYAVLAPERGHESTGASGRAGLTDGPTATPSGSGATSSGPLQAFDVAPLLLPAKDYFGVALSGAPRDMSRVEAFAQRVNGKPDMVTLYESFDDDFAAAEVRKIHQYGALTVLRWEPYRHPLTDVASGRHDAYLTKFAEDVRRLNLPIVLTVAHEMNGHWYPWGGHQTEPADFVAAWRHIHDIFRTVGATNVIWTWTPNVVNHLPHAPLKPLYPGDAYVDWIGMDGYFTNRGEQTFDALFGPTMREVGRFTRKPFLIVETGAEPGRLRARAVRDLIGSVAARPNVLGFVYFNHRGSADWVLDQDPAALAVLRTHPERDKFAFAAAAR